MQVFLVEDSEMVRERLASMLAQVPGTTIAGCAAEAAPAIRDILATRPDLVLLDVQLAGESGSGFDVLRALHAQAPQIEVVMLSNYSADPYRQLAERFGARAFFDKSNDFDRVREAVARRAAT